MIPVASFQITGLDIIDANPFASVDQSGVGQLMKWSEEEEKSSVVELNLEFAESMEETPRV